MATLATVEMIAEYRENVAHLETRQGNLRKALRTRTDLTDADFDILAADLIETGRELRQVADILGDMKAGAGDWHDWSKD